MYKRCQVFTPKQYVDILLNNANYNNNLYGKKFLENSCGNGNIIVAAVERYIKDCKKHNYSNNKISKGLSSDFVGYEIDNKYRKECIKNLNDIAKKYGIKNIKWKIYNKDYLKNKSKTKYDYIIGNPPYISYKNINIKDRLFIRKNYLTCKMGKFDYSYAFIEKSVKELSDDGVISYLVPVSIPKAVYAKNLRNYIKNYLIKLIEFGYESFFDDAIIKPAILVIRKQIRNNEILYVKGREKKKVKRKMLNDDKWVFIKNNNNNKRFGDYYKVSHCVATLCNKVFVIDQKTVDDYSLEKEVLVKTVSPKTINRVEYLIFPYKYSNNKYIRYKETDFKKRFPNAYKYLLSNKKFLMSRNSDENAKWYEYGRSQALGHINVKKILMSTIITNKPKLAIYNSKIIPYGGIYIASKNNKRYNLKEAMKILETNKFMNYVKKIGINVNGNSYRITSKDIENYYY